MTEFEKIITYQKCIELYLEGMSKSSALTYRYALQTMSRHLHLDIHAPITALPWHMVSVSDFRTALLSMRSEGMREATIKTYTYVILGIKSALYYANFISLEEREYFRSNIDRTQPSQRNPVRSASGSEMDAVLSNCKRDQTIIGLRDLALCAILFSSGISRKKITELKVNQIDLEAGYILPNNSGIDIDFTFFAKWAIPYIKPWVEFRIARGEIDGYLFTKVFKSGEINSAPLTGRGIFYILSLRSTSCELAKNVSPSSVRRAVASAIIEDFGLHAAQIILGHVKSSTTRGYEE